MDRRYNMYTGKAIKPKVKPGDYYLVAPGLHCFESVGKKYAVCKVESVYPNIVLLSLASNKQLKVSVSIYDFRNTDLIKKTDYIEESKQQKESNALLDEFDRVFGDF